MTSLRAMHRQAIDVGDGAARAVGSGRIGVVGLAVSLLAVVASPAYAWWGNLEKLSGAGDWHGEIYEFRVACFGDPQPDAALAATLTTEARTRSTNARIMRDLDDDAPMWVDAAYWWEQAAKAWALALGEPDAAPVVGTSARIRSDMWEARARNRANRVRAKATATSSAGVLWSLCKPDRERRLSIDLGWSTWDADPDPGYAGGAPINLDMLMPLVSWRVLADTNYDFVELSAGAGVYWFSSSGFESLNGVVLQPARLTFRAPSSWSGKSPRDWRRWAAIPVYAIGVTLFPAGFEPDEFAGVGEKAVRLPRELLRTQYFFVNVEPFLRMFGK